MSGCSAPSISFRPAPFCGRPSTPRPRSAPRWPRCSWSEPSTYIAAARVLEGRVVQIDPVRGREIADRDRLVLLQRHQERIPIVGALAAREGDTLDLVALPDQRLERLLLLRAAIGRLQQADQPEGERE